jgi:CHAT domain-containing protein
MEKGDSCLLVFNYDLARGYYKAAADISKTDRDKYFSNYKIGISYIMEGEDFMALAYFTDIQISFETKTAYDSATYLLNDLEIDIITVEILRPSYSVEQILNDLQRFSGSMSDWQKARAYYLLAEIYIERRYLNESNEMLKKALSFSNHNDKWLVENIYYLFLLNYTNTEDVQNINDIGMYLLQQGTKYIDKSEVFRSIGFSKFLNAEYDGARKFLRRSLLMASEKNDRFNMARDYLTLGNSYILQGDFDMAGMMYDSTEYFGLKSSKKTTQMGCLVAKAFYYFMVNDVERLEKYFELASEIIAEQQSVTYRSMLLEYIAEHYMNQGEYQRAIDSLNAFFADTETIPKDKLINQVSWKLYIDLYRLRANSGYELWKAGSSSFKSLKETFGIYRQIVRLTEESFQRYLSYDSRKIFLNKSRAACEEAFLCGYDVYMNRKDSKTFGELLSIVEQSKANVFRANFQHNKSLKISGIPDELIQIELDLKRQEAWLRHYLEDEKKIENNKEVELKLRNELVNVIARHDSLIDVFEKKYPQYFNSKYGYDFINIKRIQQNLTKKQLVLDYFLTDSRLFVLAIKKNEKKILEVSIDSSFFHTLSIYRKYIEDYEIDSITKKANTEFIESSFFLYTKLIAPFNDWIEGNQLIIIPDRELNLIPFESFLVKKESTNGIKDYLVFNNSINILYSIEQLCTTQKYISKRSRFIGFAPVYSNNISESSLFELPGAKMELKSIKNYFKGKTYIGKVANKESFFKEAMHADIIHLALHTQLSDIKPLYSEMYFWENSTQSIDTMFTYEILDKQLVSKLLVLSGCNTGYGELRYGDGVINLARSFIYSGIENLIVTQWSVADKSSSTLMSMFYNNLTKGNSVDVALQKAKIEFLLTQDPVKHHPYYWSGYISVGKPVKYHKGNKLLFVLVVSLSIFCLGFLILKKDKIAQLKKLKITKK